MKFGMRMGHVWKMKMMLLLLKIWEGSLSGMWLRFFSFFSFFFFFFSFFFFPLIPNSLLFFKVLFQLILLPYLFFLLSLIFISFKPTITFCLFTFIYVCIIHVRNLFSICIFAVQFLHHLYRTLQKYNDRYTLHNHHTWHKTITFIVHT